MGTFYRSIRPHFFFVVLFFLACSLVAYVASKPQGPHGGIVRKADDFFIEIKNEESLFSAWLLTKKLKTVKSTELVAETNFFFPDGTDLLVTMQNEKKDNGFTCQVPPGFIACQVKFNFEGKIITARFDNPLKIVTNHK
jgi:hypothetical protein